MDTDFNTSSSGGPWFRPEPEPTLKPPRPEKIGKYIILEEIGGGGMGMVYKAHNPDIVGTVAVKVARRPILEKLGPEEVRKEASLLHAASGPNVARVLDAGLYDAPEGPTPFIVTEYLEHAHQLNSTAVTGRGLRETMRLFRDAVAGVASLHAQEIIHADLKPSNILVVNHGNTWTAKVIDFGLAARLQGRDAEVHGGTTPYMAPELLGPGVILCSKASDVYALGITLHQLLAGKIPVRIPGEPFDPPSRVNPFVDSRLDRIVLRCMADRPEDRYADAGALQSALDEWERSTAVRAGHRLNRLLTLRPLLAMLALILAVWLAAVAIEFPLTTNAALQSWQARLFASVGAAACPPRTVYVIGFANDDKVKAAAQALGIPGVDPKNPVTMRPLYAHLAGKLAAAHVGVLTWDLFFEVETGHDRELRQALEAAVDAGTPVVLGVARWPPGEDRSPALCPELLASSKLPWGPATASPIESSWLVQLAASRSGAPAIPSLALQSVAALHHGTMLPVVSMESERLIDMRYRERDRPDGRMSMWNDRPNVMAVTQIVPGTQRESVGLDAASRVAEMAVPYPSPGAWKSHTLDLADVLMMQGTDLAIFSGKIVLVANLHPGTDVLSYGPELNTWGSYVQAQAMEQINQNAIRTMPGRIGQSAAVLGAALLGIAIATVGILPLPLPARRGMAAPLIAAALALVAGAATLALCLAIYRMFPIQILPQLPVTAAIFAALGAAWALFRRSRCLEAGSLPS